MNPPPIHIGLLIHGLGIGGAQQIIKVLVRWGDRQRYRYFVYCCLDGPVRAEIEADGAPVRIIERHLPKIDPGWARKLGRALQDDRIDLVHTHLFGDSLHGYFAARAAGRLPVAMTLHAKPDILPFLQRAGYRWLLSRTARVIACSESTHQAYVKAGWPGAATYATIANGIEDHGEAVPISRQEKSRLRQDLGLDQDLSLHQDSVVFGAVGRMSEEKGYAFLIRAFAQLKHPHAQLVLIGEGGLKEELRDLAAAQGVGDRVVFAGFRANVRELLPAIDVIVFSSFSEGLSIALLEAMAAARAIIGTEVEGILEAVRPEREALIVPVRDDLGLRDGLARLVEDPTLRAELGHAARQRFLERYSAQRMVREYETLYADVLEVAGR